MTLPISSRSPSIHRAEPSGSGPAFPSRGPARSAAPEGGDFRAYLARAATRLAEGDRQMDAAMREAMQGRGLEQAELIALQSSVYRYSQEMELASRLVDRATQAVKQTLQSQT